MQQCAHSLDAYWSGDEKDARSATTGRESSAEEHKYNASARDGAPQIINKFMRVCDLIAMYACLRLHTKQVNNSTQLIWSKMSLSISRKMSLALPAKVAVADSAEWNFRHLSSFISLHFRALLLRPFRRRPVSTEGLYIRCIKHATQTQTTTTNFAAVSRQGSEQRESIFSECTVLL